MDNLNRRHISSLILDHTFVTPWWRHQIEAFYVLSWNSSRKYNIIVEVYTSTHFNDNTSLWQVYIPYKCSFERLFRDTSIIRKMYIDMNWVSGQELMPTGEKTHPFSDTNLIVWSIHELSCMQFRRFWYQSFHMFFNHDDIIKWKHFPRYCSFVQWIHRPPFILCIARMKWTRRHYDFYCTNKWLRLSRMVWYDVFKGSVLFTHQNLDQTPWWRHQMETFSALLALWGIHRWPVNSPHKASEAELWCVFYLCLHKRLSTQSWGWWYETPSRSLWRHCNVPGIKSRTTTQTCPQLSPTDTRGTYVIS